MKARAKKKVVSDSKRSTSSVDAIIGTRVRAKRLEKSMSQQVLGEQLGITFQQIQKYEKGVNRIGSGRLLQIADVLETDHEFFVKGLSKTGKASSYDLFMATKEGSDIVEVMLNLNQDLQRTVIEVARRLAAAG